MTSPLPTASDPHQGLHSEDGARRGEHPGRDRQPVIKVADIAWLEFVKPDLDRAETFARDFGFTVAARTPTPCTCAAPCQDRTASSSAKARPPASWARSSSPPTVPTSTGWQRPPAGTSTRRPSTEEATTWTSSTPPASPSASSTASPNIPLCPASSHSS